MPYADVNGLHLYYEERGEGPPLVLPRGGLMTIELNFGVALPALAEHRRMIAVELQGHGTADVDRPPTSPDFATDVVALLDHLGIERAGAVGFSIGALTGCQLVISYPDRVRRAVLSATPTSSTSRTPPRRCRSCRRASLPCCRAPRTWISPAALCWRL